MTSLKLANGENINLTLNFYSLSLLKSKNREQYNLYNTIFMKGANDLFAIIRIIYTGYLCANIDNSEKCYSYEEFLKLLPQDQEEVLGIVEKLMKPKSSIKDKMSHNKRK